MASAAWCRGAVDRMVRASRNAPSTAQNRVTASRRASSAGRPSGSIAVTSARRHPLLAEVPTIAESGIEALRGFEASSWQGLFAPAGLPREVLVRLNAEVVRALDAPDIKEFFGSQGFLVGGSSPEQFRAYIASEVAKWARVIRESGAKVD